MAVAKFYDAVVTLNGSGGPPPTGGTQIPHVRSVTVNYNANMLDVTEMGNLTKVNLAGVLDWSIQVNALQDYITSTGLDALIWPLVGAASFYIQVRPTSAAVGVSNPQYYGLCVLAGYPPLSGAHGVAQEISLTFNCAGTLSRSFT